MFSEGHQNACVNRLYYACFYAVNALLASQGLSASKHSGVRALFGRHFVKTCLVSREHGVLFNDLFDYRQESDYEDFFKIDPSLPRLWIAQVEGFIDTLSALSLQDGSTC